MTTTSVFPKDPTWDGEGTSRIPFWAYTRDDLYRKELDKFLNEETLNENEIKLGHALYDLFNDYENIFVGTSNNKFNKNIILLSLREMTNLSTKEIRSSMKKYRIIYLNLVEKMSQ